jgi:DNA-binding Lrp family transcriptional regulator
LLDLLRDNARLSATALGKALNLSRPAVQERIRRLEADGEIMGFTIVTRQPETETVCALLNLTISVRPCAPVLKKLAAVPGCRVVYSTSGQIDAVMIIEVKGTEDVSRIVDQVSAISGVATASSLIILGTENPRSLPAIR